MTNIKNLFGSGGHQTAVRKGLSETMGGSSAGGVAGLLNKFDAAGLGDKARSWVGDGQKQPVSGDEVRRALGDREVDQIAQKAGMPSNEASDELASILPDTVSKLTPGGKIPDANELQDIMKKIPGM